MYPFGDLPGNLAAFCGVLRREYGFRLGPGDRVFQSAPHAFATAMAQCPHDSACQVYHALWQYLRLAEIVRSVRVDGPIYAAVAERMARAGQLRRVLITATADFSCSEPRLVANRAADAANSRESDHRTQASVRTAVAPMESTRTAVVSNTAIDWAGRGNVGGASSTRRLRRS